MSAPASHAPGFAAWLHGLALVSLALAAVCALVIAVDEVRRPQKMAVMNLVWPLTALFGSVIWLAFYWRWGRRDAQAGKGKTPTPLAVAKACTHCGAGCALGDIVAESAAAFFPAVAVVFGWKSLFRDKMFAVWTPDFIAAFLLGVAFQYFTIQPMRKLPVGAGIVAALKADAASIAAWQVGMYGAMALIQLAWFRPAYGAPAAATAPEFWLAMQLAMLAGFVTAFPVNWLLIARGLKERM